MKIVMRNVSVLVVVVALVATAVSSAALVDYQFNDDAGTDWKSVAQTGTDASQWDYNLAEGKTDGLGNAHFTGVTKDWTRKNTLATPLTDGIVALEYRISAWSMTDSIDKSGILFSINSDLKLKIEANTRASDGKENLKLSSIGSTTDNKIFYGRSISAGWDIVVRAEIDLTNNTYNTMYSQPDYKTEWQPLTTGGTFANDLTEIRMVVEGTTPWVAGEFIDVDYVTLSTVPEPTTLALLGLGALVSFRRKRA